MRSLRESSIRARDTYAPTDGRLLHGPDSPRLSAGPIITLSPSYPLVLTTLSPCYPLVLITCLSRTLSASLSRLSPSPSAGPSQVNHILKMKGLENEFPFFTTVYKISYEDTPLDAITTTPY